MIKIDEMKRRLIISSIILTLLVTMYLLNPKDNFQQHRSKQMFIDAETSVTYNSNILSSEERARRQDIWNDIIGYRIIIKDYKLFSIEYLDVSKDLSSRFNNQQNVMISFGLYGNIFDLKSGIEKLYTFKSDFYEWKRETYQPNGEKYVYYDSHVGLDYPEKIINSINSSKNNTNSLKIGDYFGGGIIAYILTKDDGVCLKLEGTNDVDEWDGKFEENKIHGIIVSENDVNQYPVDYGKTMNLKDDFLYWNPNGIGTSKLNTNFVPQNKDDYLNISNEISAITLCKSYSAGGFRDWSIPSVQELTILYLYKDYIGLFRNNFYWSSSFINSGRLPYWQYWLKDFSNGDVLPSLGRPSAKLANVRLVRYF